MSSKLNPTIDGPVTLTGNLLLNTRIAALLVKHGDDLFKAKAVPLPFNNIGVRRNGSEPARLLDRDGVRCGVHSDAQNVRGSAQDVRKCAAC